MINLTHNVSEACRMGDLESLKRLRTEGADFNSKPIGTIEYPIHHAIMNRREEAALWLIREKLVDVSQTYGEKRIHPIHLSCKNVLLRVTNELLLNGVDPNVVNLIKFYPLHYACGHRPESEDDKPYTRDPTDDERHRVARFALLLFAYGANPSLIDPHGRKPIHSFALKKGEDVTPFFKNAFKATGEPDNNLPLFPQDIWKMILRRIYGEDLFVARSVCRTWNKFIREMLFENFIKENVWVKK